MTFLGSITRGGQTWAHRMRMLRQVFRITLFGSLISGGVFFAFKLYAQPKENFQSLFYYMQAILPSSIEKIEVDSTFWCKVSKTCYKKERVEVSKGELIKISKQRIETLLTSVLLDIKNAGCISLLTFVSFTFFFLFRGILTGRKKHLHGVQIEKAWKTALKMKLLFKASDIKIGEIPLIKGSENRHMLISGTTGTGKSNCLFELLRQIRKRGDRAVVVDTTGEIVSGFYRKEDVLFNPYDIRTAKWHPWCECEESYHYRQMVSALVPQKNSHGDDFFPEAARAVLLSLLEKKGEERDFSIESFIQTLLTESGSFLFDELKDTPAATYLDPKGERTTLSIRATVSNIIGHLRSLRDTDKPFSIRDWILDTENKDQWLFLSCTTEQRQELKTLISLWMSIAMDAMKAKDYSSSNQKTWFIIDELPSLQKLECLEESLSELRKYGGCIVIATQNLSQLDKLYGHHSTRAIIDQCNTKVCFRQSDAEIASRMSSFFGQREFREPQEGLSYGAHEMRDGVSLSNIEKTKATVSATHILSLPDLEAFIKLPGNWPAVKSRFRYQKLEKIAESYIEDRQALEA